MKDVMVISVMILFPTQLFKDLKYDIKQLLAEILYKNTHRRELFMYPIAQTLSRP
jgi:hypothetical protein